MSGNVNIQSNILSFFAENISRTSLYNKLFEWFATGGFRVINYCIIILFATED